MDLFSSKQLTASHIPYITVWRDTRDEKEQKKRKIYFYPNTEETVLIPEETEEIYKFLLKLIFAGL